MTVIIRRLSLKYYRQRYIFNIFDITTGWYGNQNKGFCLKIYDSIQNGHLLTPLIGCWRIVNVLKLMNQQHCIRFSNFLIQNFKIKYYVLYLLQVNIASENISYWNICLNYKTFNMKILMKSLDPLRAKETFIRKKLGLTVVSAIQASSVTL